MELSNRIAEICPYLRDSGPQLGDSWKNRTRRIYDHQFIYGVHGKSKIVIEKKEYAITPGVLILIPPNTSHSYWVEDENLKDNETLYAHFDFFYREDRERITEIYNDPSEYVRLFGNIPLNGDLIRTSPVFEDGFFFPEYIIVSDKQKVEKLFRKMAAAYALKCTGWVLVGKQLVTTLLEFIYLQMSVKESFTSVAHKEVVEHIKQFIKANYFRKISINEVTQATGFSSDHASRIFKQITGVRLVEFIARFRVDKARELMLEPDLSLEEIGLMVGFDTQVYFSQTVKKLEGITPFALRTSLIRELNIVQPKGSGGTNLRENIPYAGNRT